MLNHPRVDMSDDVDWNLLGKYLVGEGSKEEVEKVQAWIDHDPARKALLEELRHVLNATRRSSTSETWDTEALWKQVQQDIQRQGSGTSSESDDRQTTVVPDRAPRSGTARRRSGQSQAGRPFIQRATWTGVLVITVALGVAFLLHRAGFSGLWSPSDAEAKTFATQEGQRATVRLTDGTRVRLNVDSRLSVPGSFGDGRRVVRLEGEAFFEVSQDSTLPFVIRSGGTVTQVLGTSFGISAYPEDDETKVVVTEGRVALRADESLPPGRELAPRSAPVVLTKGQVGHVLRGTERIMQQVMDTSYHLAWMEGQLAFQKAPFSEVVRKLERWYGLDISPLDEDITLEGHLNARFDEDRPLDEVLSVVATAYGLKYERREQHVTFAPT